MINIDVIKGIKHLNSMSRGYFLITIIKNALPLLILPFLTRYINPQQYGYIALFSLYFLISNSLTGVSICAVISKYFFKFNKIEVAKIIGNSVIISAVLSVLLTLLSLSFAYFPNFIKFPVAWLAIIPLSSFSFVLFSIALTVMRNSRKVYGFGVHQISNMAINISLTGVFVVLLKLNWQGRVLAIILSFIISSLFSFHYLYKNGYVILRFYKDISKNILNSVLHLIPNSLQAVVISQAGLFFISQLYSNDLLGVYSIGFQLAFLIKILGDTLNLSWYPYFFERLGSVNTMNELYLVRMIYLLSSIVTGAVIVVIFSSKLLLKLLVTPEYYGAAEFVPFLCIGFLFQTLYTFLFPALITNEKEKFISILTFFGMLTMVVSNILLSQRYGYIGIAYSFALTYFLIFIAMFIKLYHLLRLPWLRALKFWE